MFALVALFIIFMWAWLGFALWRTFIKPRLRNMPIRIIVTLLLAAVWFVGPIIDEILGAREFEQLCQEMPSDKFYGPVAIGPGVFFDEQGQPRWKNSDEFSAIRRKDHDRIKILDEKEEWKEIFDESRDEKRVIRQWPMPIVESHWVIVDRATGKTIVEFFSRHSAGGWLRRIIGIGDYQCPGKGHIPKDEEWILFKTV